MIKLEIPDALPKNKLESIGVTSKTNKEHLKLWQGYAKKNNDIVEALDTIKDLKKVNSTFSEVRSQKMSLAFAYGGYLNHKIFFNHLNGNGKPTKEFLALIEPVYGDFSNWVNDFKATCLASQGWGFCCFDFESETIQNVIGDTQSEFPIWNCNLILAVDMYEHAYFPDFGTEKEMYINGILNIIDFNTVVKNISRD